MHDKGGRVQGREGKGGWGGKDFGVGKHELNPAGAVTAPVVCSWQGL